MSSVTVKDWAVSVADLARVVQHNDLSSEVRHTRGGLILGVGGNISSLDVLDRDVLDVEANIVSGDSLGEGLVVHLHGLDLSGQHVGGEGDDHAWLDDASLNSAHGHCSNTSNFVDILNKSKIYNIRNAVAGKNIIFKEIKGFVAVTYGTLSAISAVMLPSEL